MFRRLPPPLFALLRRLQRGLRWWRLWLRRGIGLLLAVLALLGGAAFQLRNGGGLSPQLYAAVQAQAAAPPEIVHHPAAPPAPQHREQHNRAAHGPRAHHPGKHGSQTHDAGAHCPFCVTQAFGEEANPFALDPLPPDHLPAPLPQLPAAARLLPRWADARAPPAPV